LPAIDTEGNVVKQHLHIIYLGQAFYL
jgi:hypothetical protein